MTRDKFFPSCVYPFLGSLPKGFIVQESEQKNTMFHPFARMAEKSGAVRIHLKVNGYTFRGRNSSIFIFASQLNGSQL